MVKLIAGFAVFMVVVFSPFMCLVSATYEDKPTQAIAPQEIIAKTVADIPIGSQSTVPPDAVVIDESSKVWLNKGVPIGGEGVIVHYVKEGHYEVEIKDDKLRWLKTQVTEETKKFLLPVKVLSIVKPKN